MKQQDLLALIEKYLEGKAGEEEKEWLIQYYEQHQQTKEWPGKELGDPLETERVILQRLQAALQWEQRGKMLTFYRQSWFRVAAVVFLLVGAVTVYRVTKKAEANHRLAIVQPVRKNFGGKAKATLTLSDGAVFVLDSLADGVLINQSAVVIRKQGEKVIIDKQEDQKESLVKPAGYNTLDVPKGRQYAVVLPDGSQVWLNAASSLHFPSFFSGSERLVRLTGEAYFEVTENTSQPFKVFAPAKDDSSHQGAVVEVLGTHFNLNAYDDETIMKTTLLEGRVKVAAITGKPGAATETSVLSPGEQAEIKNTAGKPIAVKKVDVEEAVAWKTNVFNFNHTDLQTIMRQIARWYDVEVVYQGKVPVRYFSGKIKRTMPLPLVLEILEQSNIRFKVRGEQIVVRS